MREAGRCDLSVGSDVGVQVTAGHRTCESLGRPFSVSLNSQLEALEQLLPLSPETLLSQETSPCISLGDNVLPAHVALKALS